MPQPLAYLNGCFVPAQEAVIPVEDAGFVLGVTVTEQLRSFRGRLFRVREHLARLARSLEIVGVVPAITLDELGARAEELAAHNHRLLDPGDDLGLAMVVTPGLYPTFARGAASGPTVCLHTYPLPFHLWAEQYRLGAALATTSVMQVPETCWPRELKCRSRMHYWLADREARRMQPEARAVLLDERGRVTETATANVLVYAQGELVSPTRDMVLPGISLGYVAELAQGLGISLAERAMVPDDLAGADEVLLSSTPYCLLPVTSFDGQAIGSGQPGPVFDALLRQWSQAAGLDIAEQARRFARR